MTTKTISSAPIQDYSLVGKNAQAAVEKGLADANWYTTPIPKAKLRALLERRDGPAIRDTLLWFALLIGSGYAAFLLWGSWWAIIPFFIYWTLYASVSDSRWHETSHGTAFKTDWMNNALYEISSFMIRRESIPWVWSHARHHSDTIIVGRDLEIAVARPANIPAILLKFINVRESISYFSGIWRHSLGKMSAVEQTYIPESENQRIFIRARIYLFIYSATIILSLVLGSILPVLYIIVPNFIGSWLGLIYGLTQHTSLAENVLDHRLNTRTVYMNFINNYLYWNMGYHIEHHMYPMVPYHALPELHALIKADSPAPYRSILAAYQEIIPAVLRQAKDANYYVQRQLPPPGSYVAEGETITKISSGKILEDGWVEVAETPLLAKEDVLRFDHKLHTYAIYRSAEGEVYASDGICTHSNAHLAEGFVKGTQIECAKHNGRFDIRDGSPQRLPVCVGLKTYPVREKEGMLQIDVEHAGGYGINEAVATHTFKVVSNENVATFIKELVLTPEDGAIPLNYQPGEYLQVDIPAYEEMTLQNVVINPPYLVAWQTLGLFDLKSSNPSACRRNYSLATNPAKDKELRFNVRIATPPRGIDCYAGVGSSYVFNLKPGDTVTAIGPFGEFHVEENGSELVYLGGGAGMAPLRAHLSFLLETQGYAQPISYWYGARSLQELFYQDYFEQLAREYPNFKFHVALSDPQPQDNWQGNSGFIHSVLKKEYLDSHANPTAIEYFLCGPPLMIQAANIMLKNLGVPPTQISFDEF